MRGVSVIFQNKNFRGPGIKETGSAVAPAAGMILLVMNDGADNRPEGGMGLRATGMYPTSRAPNQID